MDAALVLIARLSVLSLRLGDKEYSKLLQIFVKRIIVDTQGEIIDFQLNAPFVYIQYLVEELSILDSMSECSSLVHVGAQRIKTGLRFL